MTQRKSAKGRVVEKDYEVEKVYGMVVLRISDAPSLLPVCRYCPDQDKESLIGLVALLANPANKNSLFLLHGSWCNEVV